MNIFSQDLNEIRLSPEEVRLLKVQITSLSNGNRVKIYLELTPFMKRLNVNVTIKDASGKQVAHTSILETMLAKMEFTMHLHEPEQGREYSVETSVYYQRMPEPSESSVDIQLPDPLVVDHHKSTFILPQMET